MNDVELNAYLRECREWVHAELRAIVPRDALQGTHLYDLIFSYPLRAAKGLRPALCIAACRGLGGNLDAVMKTAAVLELFHNAFLVHDDIEDQSTHRRGAPTLHLEYGTPIAINVGDAMLALTLQPLLDNVELVGLGRSLRIMETIARMVRECVEGQAIELEWIRRGTCELSDDDYSRMADKKTGSYSFVAPLVTGAIIAGRDQDCLQALEAFAHPLGLAFQIQDDVLNLVGAQDRYGKEIAGDLWEGKRTLILLHALRSATPDERAEAQRVLSLPRPVEDVSSRPELEAVLADLTLAGQLSEENRLRIEAAARARPHFAPPKTEADVALLSALIRKYGSIDYARGVARRYADEAAERLADCGAWLRPSVHRDLLEGLITYVHARAQ